METSPASRHKDEKPTLVIGDTHGHLDRLEALLKQEGIIAECLRCRGTGDEGNEFCPACEGDGIARTLKPATVVHVGDLGHFGYSGTPTGDMLCYKYGRKWLDVILWGNHDRAVIDNSHTFGGFEVTASDKNYFKHMMAAMALEGKLKLAHAAHGHLITHAGLHYEWANQKGIDFDKNDPYAFADWQNENDWWPEGNKPRRKFSGALDPDDATSATAVRDAISWYRGGEGKTGGILWRDVREPLYHGFPQIFGHSADRQGVVRSFPRQDPPLDQMDTDADDAKHASVGCVKCETWEHTSANCPEDYQDYHFCIDVGGKDEARLAGIWLPQKRIVRVDL